MKRFVFALAATSLLSGTAFAQNPTFRGAKQKNFDLTRQPSWSRLIPTESMYMYEQHKRDFLNPTLAIRRRAEYKAWERRSRLAAQRWYGYSNSRPTRHPTPVTAGWSSPSWTGNYRYDYYRWRTGVLPLRR